jgi:hypothetical protein
MRRRSGAPSSSSAGTTLQVALQQADLLHMVEQLPAQFGRGCGGVARTSTGWPTRASSSLMRWEMADCDSPSTCAPRSKPPCSTTAAKAASSL